MVYPEPSVFSQWQADVAMCANVKPAIKAMIDALSDFSPPSERLHWREDIHNKEAIFAQPGGIKIKGNIDLSNVIAVFQSLVPADVIISSDAGTFGRWLQRYYRSSVTNTNFGPMSGAMGYGVPGAIGAALAQPERLVFAWVGDGGFLMTGQEIATIVQEKLAVTTIVCDNSSWGSILVDQQKRFPNWDFGTRLVSPNFAKLAEGYGIAGFSVEKTDEFETALQDSLDNNGPSLIHLKLDLRDVSPFSGNAR